MDLLKVGAPGRWLIRSAELIAQEGPIQGTIKGIITMLEEGVHSLAPKGVDLFVYGMKPSPSELIGMNLW